MALGSGSVISTAHDLNRFYAALLGGRLLAPAQLDEMTTTVNAPELGVGYGLGLAEIPLSSMHTEVCRQSRIHPGRLPLQSAGCSTKLAARSAKRGHPAMTVPTVAGRVSNTH